MRTQEVHQALHHHHRTTPTIVALTGQVVVGEVQEAEVQEAIAEAGTPMSQARGYLETTYWAQYWVLYLTLMAGAQQSTDLVAPRHHVHHVHHIHLLAIDGRQETLPREPGEIDFPYSIYSQIVGH